MLSICAANPPAILFFHLAMLSTCVVPYVQLSHRNVSSVEMADLESFPALKVLDLSDNRVCG